MPKNLDVEVVAPAPERTAPTSLPRAAWLIGPALVAGVAYLDPGNVASNMTAGAPSTATCWCGCVVLGNVMAWLIQYLSAKLGIVTGRSLPETLGGRIAQSAWGRRAYWLQAELVAMATDIAEVIGGAVALNLLFGLPLLWGGVITGTVSIALLLAPVARAAPRPFEFVVIGLVAIIAMGFTFGGLRRAARPRRRRGRPRAALRGHRLRAAGRLDPRRDDHAARHLRPQRAGPRPLRAARPRRRARGPAPGCTADDGPRRARHPPGAARRAPRHPDPTPAARDAVGRHASRCSSRAR